MVEVFMSSKDPKEKQKIIMYLKNNNSVSSYKCITQLKKKKEDELKQNEHHCSEEDEEEEEPVHETRRHSVTSSQISINKPDTMSEDKLVDLI